MLKAKAAGLEPYLVFLAHRKTLSQCLDSSPSPTVSWEQQPQTLASDTPVTTRTGRAVVELQRYEDFVTLIKRNRCVVLVYFGGTWGTVETVGTDVF